MHERCLSDLPPPQLFVQVLHGPQLDQVISTDVGILKKSHARNLYTIYLGNILATKLILVFVLPEDGSTKVEVVVVVLVVAVVDWVLLVTAESLILDGNLYFGERSCLLKPSF